MNIKKLTVWLCGSAALCLLGMGIWTVALADDVPQPVLTITQTATNEFQIQSLFEKWG